MSKLLLALALTLVLVSAASAQWVYMSQDFQEGLGSWILTGTTATSGALVNDTIAQSGNGGDPFNYAFQTRAMTSGSPGQAWFNLPVIPQKTWTLEYDMYNVAGSTRDFGCGYAYDGGGTSGALKQLLALGNYNIPYAQGYHYRIMAGQVNNAVYNKTGTWDTDNNPATPPVPVGPTMSQSQYWGMIDVPVANDTWHHMMIAQHNRGDGTAAVKFFMDGALVAEWGTNLVYAPTSIRMGSGVSNNGKNSYFDNVVFTVPEPGSMLALGTGLVGLLGLIRRRRA